MNHSLSIILHLLIMMSGTSFIYCTIDQDFITQLNILKKQIQDILDQSDIDPIVAKEITNQLSLLSDKAMENTRKDQKDIMVASAFLSFLEISNIMIKDSDEEAVRAFVQELKYCARINSIHALLIGLYPNKFTHQPHYINSYAETAGFTINALLFSKALEIIMFIPSVHAILSLNTYPITKSWIARGIAGIAAHLAWNAEKGALFAKAESPVAT